MSRYYSKLRLKSEHVDMHRSLRLSVLFRLLQETAISHTEALGMGRAKTLDNGLLWVVTRQSVIIRRMPVYDESITIESWPLATMHVLFPRCYRVLSDDGEPLLDASALWTLIDSKTRAFVFPEEHGIFIEGEASEGAFALPPAPAPLQTERTVMFTVPFSYVDLNGHMNNTRYFDIAEDNISAAAEGRTLHEARVEYTSEAALGGKLTVEIGQSGQTYYLCGAAEKPCFRMNLFYM